MKAIVLTLLIFYAGIGLGPDEAQYWTWSRALDWGYYSKPPGIAWQIWLGIQLFGSTEMGIRSVTVVLSFLQAWAVYRLALKAELLPKTAFWAALCMAFSPLGITGSFFAITDVGFLYCWTEACLVTVSALSCKKAADPLRIGIWILVGALFKWPIYGFWIFYLFCHFWYFPNQKLSRLWGGIFLSLLGLIPSLIWNWSHDWATFRHVFATLQGGSGHKAPGNLIEFLGAQMLLLSPILFILLIIGGWHWIRQRKSLSPPLFFCGFVTFSSLAIAVSLAGFQKIQGNWAAFAYPTAMVLLGWYSIRFAKIGLIFSIVLTASIFIFPFPYRFNPLKHNLGWTALQQTLARQGYNSSKHFLVSDRYQTTSLLSFYNDGQKRAYFLNLEGIRKNQFSYWPSLQEKERGKTGYFVWVENMPKLGREWKAQLTSYQSKLSKYFEEVEFLELAPLIYEGPLIAKGALIFRCKNCKNSLPTDNEIY